MLTASACDTRGWNDPDAFGIHFKNDLSRPVVLALCASDQSVDCEHAYYRDDVPAGGGTAENIAPDVRTEWAIESADGQLLRCILLYWKYWPGHNETVRVSEAPRWGTPCSRETPAKPYRGH